jgi:hypothetical protein
MENQLNINEPINGEKELEEKINELDTMTIDNIDRKCNCKSINLNELRKPFSESDVEWRPGKCGLKNNKPWAMALCYVTSRAIHDRLDEVCGPENWQLRYKEHLNETIAEIGIKVNGEWIWKAGGSQQSDIESFKGGLSGAEKRAGVPWGIGRYLYKLKGYFFTCSSEYVEGWTWAKGKDKYTKKDFTFYWTPPKLPNWALPEIENITQVLRDIYKTVSPEYQEKIKNCDKNNLDDMKKLLNEIKK